MLRTRGWVGLLSALTLVGMCGMTRAGEPAKVGEVTTAEYESMKKEVEALRKKVSAMTPVGASSGAAADDNERKYGPNATASTRQGKLTIGGLLQVWYYSIQNDNDSWVDKTGLNRAGDTTTAYGSNEVQDNDSFRIRRAEIKFTMEIHENVMAVVMIDPAREATSFPTFPSNLGSPSSSDAPVYFNDGSAAGGNARNDAVRNGAGAANRMLQDAYIKYHGIIPHHDFTIGQFKRRLGEEGTRDSSQLDFAERAMVTQLADLRDLGIQVHGFWWDERVQYWLGAFNGAGTAYQQRQNRSDDNDEKDLVGSILIRPLWKDETWGSIELGYSIMYGVGGEAGSSRYAASNPVDGLNRATTNHVMQYAYGSYMPGGPVRGWWIRGEWGQYRDRFAPATSTAAVGSGAEVITGGGVATLAPQPFSVQGWYISTGYKLSDSRWADGLNGWVKPMEFTFRYENMQNLFYHDLRSGSTVGGGGVVAGRIPYVNRSLDVFHTTVLTAGINYYIKGHNAKIQFNYNWVNEEDKVDNFNNRGNPAPTAGNQNTTSTRATGRQLREVRNDSFVLNFQVAW